MALICVRRTARPIVELARLPGPSTLPRQFMPRSWRIGPFTTNPSAMPPVLALAAWMEKPGSAMASTSASTTGRYSGRQPAMTALSATFSTVTTRLRST